MERSISCHLVSIVILVDIGILDRWYCRSTLQAMLMPSCSVCPSVCPSVMFMYSVKTSNRILKLYSLSGKHAVLVFPYQTRHGDKVEFDTVGFVEFDKVDRMSKGRSTFWRQKSPAFDKVDRVEHVQLWRQCRPQQAVEFDFVASYYGRATKSKRLHCE